jgi:hypothetical protein
LANRRSGILAGVVLSLATQAGLAQEMEPRAYSPSPVGTNFVAVSVGRSHGAVLFDPTVPITDATATFDHLVVGYGRTYGVFGRQAQVAVIVPYTQGAATGLVGEAEESQRAEREGLADPRVRASIQLVGPGALTPAEFARAPRQTIVGLSLSAQMPLGEYDETKLINLGTHRWAFKPEVGVSVPIGSRWYFDAYAGAWFFTTNDDFYPATAKREQDPLTSLQAHVSYTFPSRAWLAGNATWYGGGEATVDGGAPSTRQSNTRIGLTLSLPIAARQSIKLAASTGAAARTGTDFDTYLVGWQIAWFDRPRPGPTSE